ncbi:MAG TPA: alpha/beta hydrolase [Solirubrobacteraceae bacterium]|nr:alpha/beta hydrolase [Solirubrobacteraceae bacterium]
MALAAVNGIELSYERTGAGTAGEPLLLIMGMSGTMLHWGEPFLQLLRAEFDVIAYDHRGVGRSSRLEGVTSIPQLAEDAAGLLAALEVPRAHVLGISMGGMVAQELVLADPELVCTLTLGCTYCGGPGAEHGDEETMRKLSLAMGSGDRAAALRASWEANIGDGLLGDAAAYASFLEIAEEYAVALPVVMAQMRAVLRHDTHDRLPSVRAPTLVLHGTADRMLPVGNGRMIAELIPGAELHTFEDVGHMFWWERPERSAELVGAHSRAGAHGDGAVA